MEFLFIFGRILFGGYFIWSGIAHFTGTDGTAGYAASRGIPYPRVGTLLSGALLLVGGLGVVLGVYVQIAITLLVAFLLAAAFGTHHFWTDVDEEVRSVEMKEFTKNLVFVGALLMLYMIPLPWPASF